MQRRGSALRSLKKMEAGKNGGGCCVAPTLLRRTGKTKAPFRRVILGILFDSLREIGLVFSL